MMVVKSMILERNSSTYRGSVARKKSGGGGWRELNNEGVKNERVKNERVMDKRVNG